MVCCERLRKLVYSFVYPPGVNPLPTGTAAMVLFIMIVNSTVMTMVFAYLPKMMKTFGVNEVEVGYYAGWVATSLFLSRIIFSIFWGVMVDKFGPKTIAITSSLCMAVSTLLFGLSRNFYWAFCTRFLQGMSMGCIVACKSLLHRVSDDTNQSYSMAIIITAFTTGMAIGPSVGGFLVVPAEQYPSVFSADSIFGKFKFLLPNLIISVLLIIGATTLGLCLPKMKGKNKRKEENVELSSEESKACATYGTMTFTDKNNSLTDPSDYWNVSIMHNQVDFDANNSSINSKAGDSLILYDIEVSVKEKSKRRCCSIFNKESSFMQILRNKDIMMTSFLYMLMSFPQVGFFEIVSVWAATEKQFHGLEFSPATIGLVFLVASVVQLFTFPIVSTRVERAVGAKKMMIICCLILVLVFPVIPTLAYIENSSGLKAVLVLVNIVTRDVTAGCFTTINLFQNNAVPPHLLGAANGLGLSMSAIGRTISPITFGSMYSWSLTNVKTVFPDGLGFPFNQFLVFITFSLLAFVGAIWVAHFPDRLNRRRDWPETARDDIPGNNNQQRRFRVTISALNSNCF